MSEQSFAVSVFGEQSVTVTGYVRAEFCFISLWRTDFYWNWSYQRSVLLYQFLENIVLVWRVMSEQSFALSIVFPLIRYVHSYVILQTVNWPIRAGVSQSHSITTDTQWRHRHTLSPPRPSPINKFTSVTPCWQCLWISQKFSLFILTSIFHIVCTGTTRRSYFEPDELSL